MNSRRADIWANWLWDHFLPQIASGEPFYLAADGALIQEIMSKGCEEDVALEDALYDFHDACLSLLDRTSMKATVKELAFERIPGKPYTRVICLAVQQVLVVELMLNDEQYSEHSYFPRYRELLELNDYEHLNPLGSGYFQEIWNNLEKEITSVQGSNPGTVTFFAGTGRDLNRMLPFTQALFTTHDLTVIRDRSQNLPKDSDEKVILQVLYRVRLQLGRRAQLLIASADTVKRGRLCRQIRSFLSSYDRLSALRPKSRGVTTDQGQLVAYLDTEELFADTFSVFVRSNGNQTTGPQVEAALGEALEPNGTILLASRGDSYLVVSRGDSVFTGDAVIAIVYRWRTQAFLEHVSQLLGVSASNIFKPCASNLSNRFQLLYCDRAIDSRLNSLIGLKPSNEGASGLELDGGLMVDARSKIYVAGYPPSSIRFRGTDLPNTSRIMANGVFVVVGHFLEGLRTQIDFKQYSLAIESFRLDFAISHRNALQQEIPKLGYTLENGELGLSPLPLEAQQPGLRGNVFLEPAQQQASPVRPSTLSDRDVINLLARGKRVALQESVLKALLEEVRNYSGSLTSAVLVFRQIEVMRSIPVVAATSGLLDRLSP